MQLHIQIVLLLGIISTATTLPTQPNSISKQPLLTRIVNGQRVDITEIPYQAAIRRRVLGDWVHSCGAVIIGENAVLTAAHCAEIYMLSPEILNIVVGTSFRLSEGQQYDISKIIIHELFSMKTLENDLAILITEKEIAFSEKSKPIAIAPSDSDLPDGTKALVSGYGLTASDGLTSPVLLSASVYIINQDICKAAYEDIGAVTSGMLCAAANDPPRDACQGDSGGPLVADNYLVGIVSWGEGCAQVNYPGVYTRVSDYASWISNKLEDVL